jgi:hypothetical protein
MPASRRPSGLVARVRSGAKIALRAFTAIAGGYAAVYALTAASAAALWRFTPVNRVDAALLSTNLALLAYPALAIYAFATRRPGLLLAATALGSAALARLGWALRL